MVQTRRVYGLPPYGPELLPILEMVSMVVFLFNASCRTDDFYNVSCYTDTFSRTADLSRTKFHMYASPSCTKVSFLACRTDVSLLYRTPFARTSLFFRTIITFIPFSVCECPHTTTLSSFCVSCMDVRMAVPSSSGAGCTVATFSTTMLSMVIVCGSISLYGLSLTFSPCHFLLFLLVPFLLP